MIFVGGVSEGVSEGVTGACRQNCTSTYAVYTRLPAPVVSLPNSLTRAREREREMEGRVFTRVSAVVVLLGC